MVDWSFGGWFGVVGCLGVVWCVLGCSPVSVDGGGGHESAAARGARHEGAELRATRRPCAFVFAIA